MDNFINTIKNGKLCHQNINENIICDRCYKNYVKVYVNFLHNDLCLQCVDEIKDITEINIIPNSVPLTRMNQNIFINNILTRMQQNILSSVKSITNFVILAKISENEFCSILSPYKTAN